MEIKPATSGEADLQTPKRKSTTDPLSPTEDLVTLRERARRASDSLEKGFVEAEDLLKRRREDAVLGLGSALATSDED